MAYQVGVVHLPSALLMNECMSADALAKLTADNKFTIELLVEQGSNESSGFDDTAI